MLHAMMPTPFENIGESDEIRFDVGVRVLDRVAYACLGGQIHHQRRVMIVEEFCNCLAIGNISLEERE